MTLRADTDLPPPSRSVSASWAFPGWRRAPRSKPDSFGARRHRSRRMFLPFGGADALSDDLGPVNGGFLIDREPGVTALAGPVRSQIRRISCTMRPSRRRLSTRHGGLRLWAARPRRLTELPTGRRDGRFVPVTGVPGLRHMTPPLLTGAPGLLHGASAAEVPRRPPRCGTGRSARSRSSTTAARAVDAKAGAALRALPGTRRAAVRPGKGRRNRAAPSRHRGRPRVGVSRRARAARRDVLAPACPALRNGDWHVSPVVPSAGLAPAAPPTSGPVQVQRHEALPPT